MICDIYVFICHWGNWSYRRQRDCFGGRKIRQSILRHQIERTSFNFRSCCWYQTPFRQCWNSFPVCLDFCVLDLYKQNLMLVSDLPSIIPPESKRACHTINYQFIEKGLSIHFFHSLFSSFIMTLVLHPN